LTRLGPPLALALLVACSATPTPRGLVRAEELERAGRDDEAVVAFDEAAAVECDGGERRARWCASALHGAAAARARTGRPEEAAAAFERIPAAVPSLPEAGAAALVAAARLWLELGQDARAYDLYWLVLTRSPATSAADDALRNVLADGRRRDARQLHGVLAELYARLFATPIGDNLLWALATLAREELGDDRAALEACDRMAVAHPDSPLLDDALWQGALLARAAGDAAGAERRLRALLRTRERSLVVGSYHSMHLDDAQLELARLLRDELGRPRDALAELARLPAHYPDSVLVDDALFETAATHAGLGDLPAACRALAALRTRFPESRYEVAEAPALRARLGCRDP
jgi:tetratricopeptide (TPR) repeat protein